MMLDSDLNQHQKLVSDPTQILNSRPKPTGATSLERDKNDPDAAALPNLRQTHLTLVFRHLAIVCYPTRISLPILTER